MQLEYWPFLSGAVTTLPQSHIQLLITGYYRTRVGGDPLPQGDATLVTYAINYFVDPDQSIAIGLERETGESPVWNFRDETRTMIGLRLKL